VKFSCYPGLTASALLIVGVLVALTPASRALAWGAEGHAVVADIAEAHLTDAARLQVRALLDFEGKTNLDQISSWADIVRLQRRDTGPWHYVDIPLVADSYDPARDCPGGQCVVAKITDFTAVLASSKTVSTERVEALKWIVHFVGDVHQPLHAEDDGDKGGNAVPVLGFGKRANLHSIWDTALIEADDRDETDLAKKLDARITPQLIKQWSGSTPAAWAVESHRIAQTVGYGILETRPVAGTRPEPEVIDGAYRAAATQAIEMRLEQAGVRLADLLNQALR
jgi:S1/P1 Nuclease